MISRIHRASVAARSIALIAFGLDSVIEFVSAAVVLARLRTEYSDPALTAERVERVERRAARVVGWSLLLATYIVIHSAYILV